MTDALFRLRSDITFTPVRCKGKIQYVVDDTTASRIIKMGAVEYALCSQFLKPMPIQEGLAKLPSLLPHEFANNPSKLQKYAGWLIQSGMLEHVEEHHSESAETQVPSNSPGAVPAAGPPPGAPGPQPGPPPGAPKSRASKAPVKLFDPSFFRMRLLTPKAIDRICKPWLFLISWPMLAVAVCVWIAASVFAFENFRELQSIGVKLFVPGSQWWWLVAWFVLKAVHEFGHALACTKVGARTSGAGLGFMFFAPTPFVDVTRVWNVQNRWSRILVSASGMIFEMSLASIAVMIACWTESASVKCLMVSIASLGTLTTLAFNANPLMRYDGYYIAIDCISRPNLWQDANRSLKSMLSALLLKDTPMPQASMVLILYGLASWISRITMLITMGWGVFIAWDGIGVAVVGFFVCLWYVAPKVLNPKPQTDPSKQTKFLQKVSLPKLAKFSAVSAVVCCLTLLPSPIQVYWPGVVDYVDSQDIRSQVAGFVVEVHALDGQGVKQGDPLVQLANPDLELAFHSAKTALELSIEKCNSLRNERKLTELQNEESLQQSLRVQYESLETKINALCVRATRDGILIARGSQNWLGNFVQEGQALGFVANPDQVEVRASIPQSEWETLARSGKAAMLVSVGSSEVYKGELLQSLPRTEEAIDSPALAAIYGGPLVVNREKSPNGEEQLKTTQPRLATRIRLPETEGGHGHHSITPPLGAVCSVRFASNQESILGMILRWSKAVLEKKLPTDQPPTT